MKIIAHQFKSIKDSKKSPPAISVNFGFEKGDTVTNEKHFKRRFDAAIENS